MGTFVHNVRQLRRFITSREFATDIRRTYFALRITVAVIGFSSFSSSGAGTAAFPRSIWGL